jgi:XTP/dITP diphosphohydrolase
MLKREEKRNNNEIILVTSNEHKYMELNEIAKEYNISLKWVNIPKPEIQSDDLQDIVRFSAVVLYNQLRSPLIVEDSGLFIEALNGFPGPYTNYVRRTIGLEGVLKLMQGVKNRKAYFSTVMCYISESDLKIFEGRVYGKISSEIRGEGGFGFDPIFIPDGEDRTFAEMRIEEKNKYSHRSNAFKKFIDYYLYRKVS